MSIPRTLKRRLVGLFVLSLIVAIWAFTPAMTNAQCEDPPPDSSCYTCHEETYPVFESGEWHQIHARKDCCWNCHGGNTQTMDQDLAHQGMTVQPLENTYTDCYACHPNDYAERAERFGAALGIAPVNQAPTPQAYRPSAPNEDLQLVILPSSEKVQSVTIPWYPELVCLLLAVLALIALFLSERIRSQNVHL
jgi:hypothetical protein